MFQTWEDALLLIPSHMHDAVTRYLEYGINGGDFMMAVLSNDFMGACCRADWGNKEQLAGWGDFLLYCPYGSYGSHEKVMAWMKSGGLKGREKETVSG